VVIWAAVGAVCGTSLASFLNVVAWRVPRGESVVKPPSHCPHCGHRLGWADLVPVVSYLLLRGRCRYCGASVPVRYTVVEALGAVLGAILLVRCGPGARLLPASAAGSALLTGLALELHGSSPRTRGDRLRLWLWLLAMAGLVLAL